MGQLFYDEYNDTTGSVVVFAGMSRVAEHGRAHPSKSVARRSIFQHFQLSGRQ